MSQDVVSFQSAGLRLHGVVSVPEGARPGERRAAFLAELRAIQRDMDRVQLVSFQQFSEREAQRRRERVQAD